MDAALLEAGLKIAMMAIGGISLYIGYRLFCDTPRVSQARAHSVVLRNFVAGALLAVVGLGILFTAARSLAAQNHEAHRRWNRPKPAQQGSYETPRLHRERVVQRTI